MEQAIVEILGGELTTDVLLLLVILAFVTKRIVPWWVYETMEQKLKEHEAAAPALVDAVDELLSALDELQERQGNVPRSVQAKKEELRHVLPHSPRRSPRKRTRTP